MAKAVHLLFYFILTLGFSELFAQSSYKQEIQKERDEFHTILMETDSILNKEEQVALKEISYFDIDSSWRVTAKIKRSLGRAFYMPTTTDRTIHFRRIGWLKVKRGKEKFKLAAYAHIAKDSPHDYTVFVPFRDSNAPEITYGGGRYLDLEILPGQKEIVIDFNEAYNPYCVYSYRYSCPMTPKENYIKTKVTAGSKNPVVDFD